MDNNAELVIEGYSHLSHDPKEPGSVHVTIRDAASTQALVVFHLSATQWLYLSAGTHLRTKGWMVPPELRDRLGKRMQNVEVAVPDEVVPRYTPQSEEESVIAGIRQWADLAMRGAPAAPGAPEGRWNDYDEPRRTNRGTWAVIFRRWVEVEPDGS